MSHRPINAAYLERKLRAILGMQGGNPLPQMEDIQGLLCLENDRPEWSFPANERLLVGTQGTAAFAGELSWAGVAVPRNAGVIAIVESFDTVTQPGQLNIRVLGDSSFDAMFAASVAASLTPRDLRDDPLIVGSATRNVTGHAAALGGLGIWAVQVAGNMMRDKCSPLPVILVPGTAFLAVGSTVNVAINSVMFTVRERPLEGDVEIK